MVGPDAKDEEALQANNMHGTSPSRYSDIVETELSSVVPTGTSGIGAKKVPKENQDS